MGAVPSSDRDLDFFGWLGNEIGSEKLQKNMMNLSILY